MKRSVILLAVTLAVGCAGSVERDTPPAAGGTPTETLDQLLANAPPRVIDEALGTFTPNAVVRFQRIDITGDVHRFETGHLDSHGYRLDYTTGAAVLMSRRHVPANDLAEDPHWLIQILSDEMYDTATAVVMNFPLTVSISREDGLIGVRVGDSRGEAVVRVDKGLPAVSDSGWILDAKGRAIFEELQGGESVLCRYDDQASGTQITKPVDLSGFNQAIRLARWMLARQK